MSLFDAKNFNGEVFQKYVDTIPNTKRNELIKSRAIRQRPDLAQAMSDQTGGNYITTPLMGLISGSTPTNYDGSTNIDPKGTETYTHSRVVVGRSNGWTEKDFSYDITGGADFMENVARQISEYWDEIDQATIIHILNGVFAMNDDKGETVKASDYSYNAEIPDFRECGIVMLADSIEAASRTVTPNASKYSKLIDTIFMGKIERGQLNNSGLTMNDIKTLSEAFVKALVARNHSRIEYPDED